MIMGSSADRLSSSFSSFRSASSWFELYAAFSTFMMLLRTAIKDLLPQQVRSFILSKLKAFFFELLPNSNTLVSLEISQNWDGQRNLLYHAAKEYLPGKIARTYKSLKVGKLEKHKNMVIAVGGKQEVVDEFEGMKLTWKHSHNSEKKDSKGVDKKKFTLSFDEKQRERVINSYIPHVLSAYEAIKAEQRIIKIHSLSSQRWKQSELTHPATFDSLALDPELKQAIIDDLERFLRRKEFYKRVGKPWKRGYLLYGPPGTGKSSLIAAMANYLKFDVYDLELTHIFSNSDLMRAMRDTANRSIVVIEDIDCNREVHARSKNSDYDSGSDSDIEPVQVSKTFTLSGLLNNMDGLWSSSGEERIIVFTTNHVDRIDPALLRPGRMDMHIHLSNLKAKAFRILASNYLEIEGHHPLFEQIGALLEKVEVSPAAVAEQLMRSEDPDVALEALVKFLEEKEMEGEPEKLAEKPLKKRTQREKQKSKMRCIQNREALRPRKIESFNMIPFQI